MKQTSKTLLIVAELLFLSALVLPALEGVLLDKVFRFEGWRAALVAVWGLSDAAKHPTLILVGVAGLGNIVFLIAPWLLLFATPSTTTLRVFGGAVLGALALALWSPQSGMVGSPKLLIGYFIWLVAYAALMGSIVLLRGNNELRGKRHDKYA